MRAVQRWAHRLWRDAYRPEAFRKGVIAGLLSALPFILCMLLDAPLLAIFTSLAAVRLGMADPGGAFAYRLRTMAAGTVCVTLGCYLGTSLAEQGILVLPLVFLLVLGFAYLGALGPEGLAVSVLTLFLTVVSLGVPGDPELRAAAVFGACLFMIASLLAPWPLHPARPVRRAMAAALRAVADLALAVSTADGTEAAARKRARWTARTAAYRSLDAALECLSETLPRRRRGSRPTALRQLLAAAAAGQRLTRALTTMAEYRSQLPDWLAAAIEAEAAALRQIAGRLDRLTLRRTPATGLNLARPEDLQAEPTGAGRAATLSPAMAEAHGEFLSAARDLRLALLPGGAPGDAAFAAMPLPQPGRVRRLPGWAWSKLRANLTLQSTACRHALRQAALVTVATGIVWHFQISFGYWAMLTVVMVTKPAYGGTRKAVGARMLGTILGAGLAELVLFGTQDFWVLVLLALLFNCLSHAVITCHYALGITLLTMYVIFKIDAALPDTDVAMPRLTATLLGGALIAASLLLWPPVRYSSYWAGVGRCMANFARMAAALARRAADGPPSRPAGEPDPRPARRDSRMNLQNAEAVVAEIQLEPASWHPNRRELRSVVDGLHRLTGVMAALHGPQHDLGGLAGPLADTGALLEEMAMSCAALDRDPKGPPPPPWPADQPRRVRQATAPLLDSPDEVLQGLAAATRDLAEDLAVLARLRTGRHEPEQARA